MEAVEITVKVDESRLEDYQKIAEDFGVLELSISKPLIKGILIHLTILDSIHAFDSAAIN